MKACAIERLGPVMPWTCDRCGSGGVQYDAALVVDGEPMGVSRYRRCGGGCDEVGNEVERRGAA